MSEPETQTHQPFTYDGVNFAELTDAEVQAMTNERRMELLDAVTSHVVSKGGENVLTPEEQAGALRIVAIQRHGAKPASKKKAAAPATPSLDDFE